MSWLGLLNFIILQWFHIRLAKEVDCDTGIVLRYRILKWIIPLSGWWNDYTYLVWKK